MEKKKERERIALNLCTLHVLLQFFICTVLFLEFQLRMDKANVPPPPTPEILLWITTFSILHFLRNLLCLVVS